jgi:hypothetical protein
MQGKKRYELWMPGIAWLLAKESTRSCFAASPRAFRRDFDIPAPNRGQSGRFGLDCLRSLQLSGFPLEYSCGEHLIRGCSRSICRCIGDVRIKHQQNPLGFCGPQSPIRFIFQHHQK